MDKDQIPSVAEVLGQGDSQIIGITGSPTTTIKITIDIKEESKLGRILGQMVHFVVEEDRQKILVVGQVISIETQNRWHEDSTFKGVIRLHGKLPHLSGRADNRIAEISVQATYSIVVGSHSEARMLGTSPSTGIEVRKMSNQLMAALMKTYDNDVTYMGHVYGTEVHMPFWFRHFGKNDPAPEGRRGAGDAHHIGVFGKSGSGKSVTAAYMLMGYAKNSKYMNILVLDPQKQFSLNKDLPNGLDLEVKVRGYGMEFKKYSMLDDLCLPGSEHELFSSLLMKKGFIRRGFGITTEDKDLAASIAIASYLSHRYEVSEGKRCDLNRMNTNYSQSLMEETLGKFIENSGDNEYMRMVYAKGTFRDDKVRIIKEVLDSEDKRNSLYAQYWAPVMQYFMATKTDGTGRKTIDDIVDEIADPNKGGRFIVLDISSEKEPLISENVRALFVRLIEERIKRAGEECYAEGKRLNCLIVLDEAHRFISSESDDPQIKSFTKGIIDSVRTTRKYGIGYMFITQTIESLDKEILQQTRIFAFGYGLTLGTEIRVISNIVNNEAAIQLYRSFIDPSSTNRYPFMFYGSVSPLSFTGSPLFLEVYTDPADFK
ncbi:MAG: ATP-binding protein [candidate division Zixibacteria bacterium]|nr:ATP-binding protein [candidate division Zixibacteria bacterium]